jgi:hypothetical protein
MSIEDKKPFSDEQNALLEKLLRNLSKAPNEGQNHPKGCTCP